MVETAWWCGVAPSRVEDLEEFHVGFEEFHVAPPIKHPKLELLVET